MVVGLLTHCRSVTVHEVVGAILRSRYGGDVKITEANDLKDFYVSVIVLPVWCRVALLLSLILLSS